jgi:hypothetical protein
MTSLCISVCCRYAGIPVRFIIDQIIAHCENVVLTSNFAVFALVVIPLDLKDG